MIGELRDIKGVALWMTGSALSPAERYQCIPHMCQMSPR